MDKHQFRVADDELVQLIAIARSNNQNAIILTHLEIARENLLKAFHFFNMEN